MNTWRHIGDTYYIHTIYTDTCVNHKYVCVCNMCTPKRLGVWQKSAANSSIQSSNWQYINHMSTMFILPCSESFATTCYRNQNIYLHTLAIKTGSDLWQWHCTHEEHSTSVVLINKGLISPYTAGYCTMFLVIFSCKIMSSFSPMMSI